MENPRITAYSIGCRFGTFGNKITLVREYGLHGEAHYDFSNRDPMIARAIRTDSEGACPTYLVNTKLVSVDATAIRLEPMTQAEIKQGKEMFVVFPLDGAVIEKIIVNPRWRIVHCHYSKSDDVEDYQDFAVVRLKIGDIIATPYGVFNSLNGTLHKI